MQKASDPLSLDYPSVESEIVIFIRDFVSKSHAKGTVIGLSGGVDSSVVGALCVKALGHERVVGLLMPASFTPSADLSDAEYLVKTWGIGQYMVAIDPTVSTFLQTIPTKGKSKIAEANVRARIRMTINYYYANLLGYVVAGTGDRSEDLIGYFTKYGDGGVDFLPIAHLYKTQVRALAKHLGLPERIVSKPSSPQLWAGHKATDEIPADYDKLDLLLHSLFDEKQSPSEAAKQAGVSLEVVNEVLKRNRESEHKRTYPAMVRAW